MIRSLWSCSHWQIFSAHGCVWWRTSCVLADCSSLIRLACCAAPLWLDYLLCNESDWLRAVTIALITGETGPVSVFCCASVWISVCYLHRIKSIQLCVLYPVATISYFFSLSYNLFFFRSWKNELTWCLLFLYWIWRIISFTNKKLQY